MKCTAEICVDQCAETGKHKLEANDFEVCAHVKKGTLDLDHKEIVDAINKKIKTSGLVQGCFDAQLKFAWTNVQRLGNTSWKQMNLKYAQMLKKHALDLDHKETVDAINKTSKHLQCNA